MEPMNNKREETRPITVGEWMIIILILAIPLVNLIMSFVWAFSRRGNINRRNFCRAGLLMSLIFLGIAVLILILGSLISAADLPTSY